MFGQKVIQLFNLQIQSCGHAIGMNKVLRRILGPKTKDVKEEQRTPQNGKHHNIVMIK
jgi:hypothetical protein